MNGAAYASFESAAELDWDNHPDDEGNQLIDGSNCGKVFDADRGPCLECAHYERCLECYEIAFRNV